MLTLPVDMSYFAIKGAGVCHQTMNKKTIKNRSAVKKKRTKDIQN